MFGAPTPLQRIHFVDFENVSKHVPINDIATGPNRAIILVGATQNPPNEWLVPGLNISWVQIQKVGKDNLDFHLVLEVGYAHAKAPMHVEFIIWTGDRGMDETFRSLARVGRKMTRYDPRPTGKQRSSRKQITAPKTKQSSPKTGKRTIAIVGKRCVDILEKTSASKRPRKKKGLINHIENWKKGINFPQQSAQIFDWLSRNGTISLGEHDKITYNL